VSFTGVRSHQTTMVAEISRLATALRTTSTNTTKSLYRFAVKVSTCNNLPPLKKSALTCSSQHNTTTQLWHVSCTKPNHNDARQHCLPLLTLHPASRPFWLTS
jgi:hypothetical protein